MILPRRPVSTPRAERITCVREAMNDDFVVEYIHGQHTLREYFDRLFPEVSLDHAWAGCPELAAACREHLWAGFAQVDAIPRSDVFWRNSNMRTTFTKVGDFYVKNADSQLRDPKGAWQAFAVAVCRGDASLFFRAATVLYRFGDLDLAPVIRLSFNIVATSGWETDEPLANTLAELNVVGSARAYLEKLTGSGVNYLPEWATMETPTGSDVNYLPEWATKVLRRLPPA